MDSRALTSRRTIFLVCLLYYCFTFSLSTSLTGCKFNSEVCESDEVCNEEWLTGKCEPVVRRGLFVRDYQDPYQDDDPYTGNERKSDESGYKSNGRLNSRQILKRTDYENAFKTDIEEYERNRELRILRNRQILDAKIKRELEREQAVLAERERREMEVRLARRILRQQFLESQNFNANEDIFEKHLDRRADQEDVPPEREIMEEKADSKPIPAGYSHDIRIIKDDSKSIPFPQQQDTEKDVRKDGLPPIGGPSPLDGTVDSTLGGTLDERSQHVPEIHPVVVPQDAPVEHPIESVETQTQNIADKKEDQSEELNGPKGHSSEMTILKKMDAKPEVETKPVLVAGKLHSSDVLKDAPEAHPEGTDYQRVKEFFQAQQISSIVDVPKTEKKEKIEFFQNDGSGKAKSADDGGVTLLMEKPISLDHAKLLVNRIRKRFWTNIEFSKPIFSDIHVDDSAVSFRVDKGSGETSSSVIDKINDDLDTRELVQPEAGARMVAAESGGGVQANARVESHPEENKRPRYFTTTLIVVGCVSALLLIVVCIYMIMKKSREDKFRPVTVPGQEAADDYRELCRQLKATQGVDMPVSTQPLKQYSYVEKEKGLLNGKPPKYNWSEEPVVPKMDILTGHVVLSYMEDHLNNKDRLNKEWEALCSYEAEPNSTRVASDSKNGRKNRYQDVLPYDHTRVVLRETVNATGSDYINASFIFDHDPRKPAYVATQGPLAHTVSDFWQMVWEQGVVVIVNLTKLSDLGMPQCHRYWPEKGCETYHVYEVHLVSEHIWCDDYLVRSFYLKNLQTNETRTITQFHYLSWPDLNVPPTPKPLLEFRRKVNKCFRGGSCPVVVHCSGGVGRTGTYVLIDMVLNKMMKGAKEIDIAATVEHLRDQRPHMVKTKAQFEFALTAVAEEVNAILQAIPK